MNTSERVLLVDDDPNILKAYERRLRRKFDVETAMCSEEGVTAVNFLGPFAVIVSDMAMPRENGADFLERMLQVSPDSVRIMLTGNADQATAVQAVNQARVFRFLSKPCQADELEAAIQAGIEEHRQRRTERELMSQTVHGVVAMLTRVLSLTSPTAFGRATRLRALAKELAAAAEIDDAWELEIAASLSQLGAVTLTEPILAKLANEQPLSDAEAALIAGQYTTAAELIGEAPRLDGIARIVALQSADVAPTDEDSSVVCRNAGLLGVALRFDRLTGERGVPRAEALQQMVSDAVGLDVTALDALRKVVAKQDARRLLEVDVEELSDAMHLVADVATTDGMVLVAKGHDVTVQLKQRLQNYAATHEIELPIRVLASTDVADEVEAARCVTA